MKAISLKKFREDISNFSSDDIVIHSCVKGSKNYLLVKTPLYSNSFTWKSDLAFKDLLLLEPDAFKKHCPFFVFATDDGYKELLYIRESSPDFDNAIIFGKGKKINGIAIYIQQLDDHFKIAVFADLDGKHEQQILTATSDIKVPLIIATILEAFDMDFNNLPTFEELDFGTGGV